MLKKEIYQFNPDLELKPIIVCQTKNDLEVQKSKEWYKIKEEIIEISSITGKGLNNLINKIISIDPTRNLNLYVLYFGFMILIFVVRYDSKNIKIWRGGRVAKRLPAKRVRGL